MPGRVVDPVCLLRLPGSIPPPPTCRRPGMGRDSATGAGLDLPGPCPSQVGLRRVNGADPVGWCGTGDRLLDVWYRRV